jgi:hypothetical protein
MIDQNFVYIGAIINLIGSTNYCWNTIKGRTRPNRVTWFLWALAPLIAFAAMLDQGVSFRLSLMTFMVGFGPLLVFLSSFVNRNSIWKITKFDIACGALSLIGLVAWLVTRTGNVAIFFSIVADGLALLPTLVKSVNFPESESYLVFMNGAISAAITLLAVDIYDFKHLGFPIYIFATCVLLFVLIKFKLGVRFRKMRIEGREA